MRKALLLSFALGCAHQTTLDVPINAAPSFEEVTATAETPSDKCIIDGPGELEAANHVETEDLEIYAQVGDWEPAIVVQERKSVRVRWSLLPPATALTQGVSDPATRAHVDIGGQRHVRMPGYASLAGRAFQLRTRADAIPDHVWIRKGRDVQVVGMDGDQVVVEAKTGLTQPEKLRARVACEAVAYEPDEIPQTSADARPSGGTVMHLSGSGLHLMDAPRSNLGLRIVPSEDLEIVRLEIRSGHARVAGEIEGIVFDGWVPEEDITTTSYRHVYGRSISGSSSCGSSGGRVTKGTVNVDTQLYVGKRKIEGAFVEHGASIIIWNNEGPMTSFAFEDNMMRAPDDKELWIDSNALTIVP